MFKSSFIVMFINMLSRLLGLGRETLIGKIFGATGLTDSYFGAFKVTNFFTSLLGEGSLGTVFIPLYNEKKNNEGLEKANEFVSSLLNIIMVFASIISILMIIFSKGILKLVIGFKDQERFVVANNLLKIMAFYFLFIALSGIISSYLNNYKKFLISTSTALVFNITIIIGVLIASKYINNFGVNGIELSKILPFLSSTKKLKSIYIMGFAVLLSGFFQLLIQLPQFFKLIKGGYRLKFDLKDKYIRELFIIMIPTLVGIFGYQINEMVSTRFAASLSKGVMSSMIYATRLYLLPIGVFAISLSVVIFPTLYSAISNKDNKKSKEILQRGMNLLAFLIIPSLIALFFYAESIVTLIYKRGKFNDQNVITTAQSLKFYAIGLLFFSTIHLLTRSHYAYKDRILPLFSSLTGIIVNIVLNFLLYKKFEHMGLSFSTSVAAFVNFMILLISLNKRYIKINIKKYIIFIIKATIASIIAYIVSRFIGMEILGNFEILLKLFIFGVVYLFLWSRALFKKRIKMFD